MENCHQHRAPRHTGMDSPAGGWRVGRSDQHFTQLCATRHTRSLAGWGSGGGDSVVRNRSEFSDLAFSTPDDPWGESARTRIDRPIGGDSSHRSTSGDPPGTAHGRNRHKRLIADPVLVGSLIAIVVAVVSLFVAGALI